MKLSRLLIPLLFLLLATLACNLPASTDEGATATFNAVLTKISGTVQAPPTLVGTPIAGLTPLPTALPTVVQVKPTETAAPTNTPNAQGCVDGAEFVTDVTIPDNTVLTPGTAATKTWRLKNSGTCTWVGSYNLVFVNGAQMGGQAAVAISGNVAPGSQYDISVNLTAPTAPGTYVGRWQMRNSVGKTFGTVPYVQIIIAAPTATVGPSSTATVKPTETAGPTNTPNAQGCVDGAQFVADVTIPDNTTLAPGAVFVKTWRLKNTGTCNWTSAYAWAFVSDNQMGAPAVVQVSGVVTPGAQYDASVTFIAPTVAGTYVSRWRMRNSANVLFGSTPYVQIVVSGASATPTASVVPATPSATPTPTATTVAATATATATETTAASPTPTATPIPVSFTATYGGSWNCGAVGRVSFQITNNTVVALESLQYTVEGPLGTVMGGASQNTPFKSASSEVSPQCTQPGADSLASNSAAWVHLFVTLPPVGTVGRANLKLCTLNDLGGACQTVAVDFVY